MFEAKREAKREHIRNSNGKARRSRNMKEKKRGAYTGKISNQSLQRPMAQTATASR
jgi:triosephosphate isomerase